MMIVIVDALFIFRQHNEIAGNVKTWECRWFQRIFDVRGHAIDPELQMVSQRELASGKHRKMRKMTFPLPLLRKWRFATAFFGITGSDIHHQTLSVHRSITG